MFFFWIFSPLILNFLHLPTSFSTSYINIQSGYQKEKYQSRYLIYRPGDWRTIISGSILLCVWEWKYHSFRLSISLRNWKERDHCIISLSIYLRNKAQGVMICPATICLRTLLWELNQLVTFELGIPSWKRQRSDRILCKYFIYFYIFYMIIE